MSGIRTMKAIKRSIAGAYVLAMVFVAFASLAHADSSGAAAVAGMSPVLAQTNICQGAGDGRHDGHPSNQAASCCDLCIFKAAADLATPPTSQVIFRLGISTRFAFASRLGCELDRSPDDLRSRAPPRLG